jgi:single-stranded-DNA-specific exonuclease
LNAAGRLADASPCVELLTTGDATTARIVAANLEALNARRKALTDLVWQQAQAQIEGDRSLLDRAALVLESPFWHPGIIGIVASRLVDRYGRPAVLISTAEGGPGRGSARSIEGVDISAAIAACQDLLRGFGGHPMAAGLTIDPERVRALRDALSAHVAGQLEGRTEPEAVEVDCLLPLPELSLDLVADISRLGPFGAGNPPLTLFAPRLEVMANRIVGRQEEHRILTVADESGFERQVVWWNGGSEAPPQGLFDLAYMARASTYRGERSVQVELLAWRTSPGEPEIVVAPLSVEALDFRQERAALPALQALLAEGDATVFAEGEVAESVPGRTRLVVEPARTLVFWTTPPSPAEVRAALAAAMPERVALFGVDPGLDRPDAFLRRLSGLVKHALNHRAGRASVAELAAGTAQRETVALLGLRWLASTGSIDVAEQAGGGVLIRRGNGRPAEQAERDLAAARLRAALEETAAFRAYFRSADKDALLRGYLA